MHCASSSLARATPITIVALAASAYGASQAVRSKIADNSSATVAPPKTLARMPISVIPTCTVERKRMGFSARVRAVRAPLLPLSAR